MQCSLVLNPDQHFYLHKTIDNGYFEIFWFPLIFFLLCYMKKIVILYLIRCLPCEIFLQTFSSSWKIVDFFSFFFWYYRVFSLVLPHSSSKFWIYFFHSSFWLLLKYFPIVINITAFFKEPSLILKCSFIDFQTRIFHLQCHLDKWPNSVMSFTSYRRKILLNSDNNIRYIKLSPLEHPLVFSIFVIVRIKFIPVHIFYPSIHSSYFYDTKLQSSACFALVSLKFKSHYSIKHFQQHFVTIEITNRW